MKLKSGTWLGVFAVLVLTVVLSQAEARDAAFLDPGMSGAGTGDDAIRVEPKGDIDTGESILNVARHTTLFFVNQTSQPVQVEKVDVNSDGNVKAEISSDDCSKQATIPAQSRCSVEVTVTPSTPGAWGVEVLLTHNGAGRIARSKLTGKTSGSSASTEKKDTGLALSTKDNSPVSFGDVEVGAKSVRSALMVNDSPDSISLYAIDVIEAENGLQKLDQGCAVDMELKPGESCPVTLVWTPQNAGQVSTDLIIRHSGRLGFVVIPIRGNAKGAVVQGGGKEGGKNTDKVVFNDGGKANMPPPPSAQDLEKNSGAKIPAMSASALGIPSTSTPVSGGSLRLIGTVGTRAVLLQPDGTTLVVSVGETFDVGDHRAKLVTLSAKTAAIMIDGHKKELILGAAPELTSKIAPKNSGDNTLAADGGGSGSTLGAPLGPTPPASLPAITPLVPAMPATTGGAK